MFFLAQGSCKPALKLVAAAFFVAGLSACHHTPDMEMASNSVNFLIINNCGNDAKLESNLSGPMPTALNHTIPAGGSQYISVPALDVGPEKETSIHYQYYLYDQHRNYLGACMIQAFPDSIDSEAPGNKIYSKFKLPSVGTTGSAHCSSAYAPCHGSVNSQLTKSFCVPRVYLCHS
ncbi:MAG TPA: hypothetical protein VJB02_05945 [Coxiellaceae bacterium]|nr:hypothetical protein [Coxiellaceae bacterium]